MPTGTPEEERIRVQIARHRLSRTWHYEDEENMYEGIRRAGRFFSLAKKDRHDVVLAVTHDGTIRLLLGYVLLGSDAPLEQQWRLHWSVLTSNASISVVEYRKGWGWNLKLYNDCSHLEQRQRRYRSWSAHTTRHEL
jgi:broad specificity phosphatase PhoE